MIDSIAEASRLLAFWERVSEREDSGDELREAFIRNRLHQAHARYDRLIAEEGVAS